MSRSVLIGAFRYLVEREPVKTFGVAVTPKKRVFGSLFGEKLSVRRKGEHERNKETHRASVIALGIV